MTTKTKVSGKVDLDAIIARLSASAKPESQLDIVHREAEALSDADQIAIVKLIGDKIRTATEAKVKTKLGTLKTLFAGSKYIQRATEAATEAFKSTDDEMNRHGSKRGMIMAILAKAVEIDDYEKAEELTLADQRFERRDARDEALTSVQEAQDMLTAAFEILVPDEERREMIKDLRTLLVTATA